MAKLWRVTCIWIFCVSCLFERIQLPTVTAAVVPFDYFEDHEQLSYDLDTEQSKAKYDTRLLSEQLLKEQKSAESSHARPHGGGGGTDGDDADDVEADVDDDLQPHERAASCYNNGHKYTHGQKVPRQDACEVCLCMDGEIFCWWELCGNKRSNQPTTTYHADSHLSASTAMEGFDGRTSTMQPTSSTQQQFSPNSAAFQHSKKPTKQHTTKSLKMKSYLQQQHQQQQQKLEQQKQLQQKHPHKHAHPHEHSAASLPPLSASSKILNFPENLPSVLYHDYRTEEHQHHQHQHHQQHLKHLKQQQRLLHQQQQLLLQQQQQQQQQRQHMQHVSTAFARATVPPEPPAPPSAGDNENVSDETETDSDILPEPPTKKPKVTATTTTTTTTTTATINAKAAAAKATATTATTTSTATSMPSSQGVLSRLDGRDVQPATQSASASRHGVGVAVDDDSAGGQKSSSESRAELASAALKPAAPQQSAPADSLAISNQPVEQQPASSRSSSSSEENQDDAFHRWLTSTETNNNSNNSNNAVDDATLDAARTADLYGTAESQNLNTTTSATNASFQSVGAHSPQQDSDVYFRSSYNDYSSEFNGSVVNIDILLTTADDRQQQQSRQQQQQHKREPLSPAADLIANHSRARTADNSDSSNRAAATQSAVAVAGAAAANTSSLPAQGTSTPSPSRQCNVMGTLYKIGDVLPQDTGNCLQCVCIDGSTSDDTPRITCSPHNCPPLVLPDLFDATGY